MTSKSAKPKPLAPASLRQVQDPADIPFDTTRDAVPFSGCLGQSRAESAMAMGLAVNAPGYNLFVMGQPGSGRRTLISQVLAGAAALRPAPPDLLLVPDLDHTDHPRLVAVAHGRGRRFCQDLRTALYRLVDRMTPPGSTEAPLTPRTKTARERMAREVDQALDPLIQQALAAEVQDFLHQLKSDLIHHRLPREDPAEIPQISAYQVTLLVDHTDQTAAPVIVEEHPTAANLTGTVVEPKHGGHPRVRAGALHRANGGYLVADAGRLLKEPGAWTALKRCLTTGRIHLSSANQPLVLEPVAVPLDVKVVLYGTRALWQSLCQQESELDDLFKVEVDFEDTLARDPANTAAYAEVLAALVARESDRDFDRHVVARFIEEAARLTGDATKLSLTMGPLVDLIRECDYQAGKADRRMVGVEDLEEALTLRRYHSGRFPARLHERVRRGSLMIQTRGQQVGVINGLTVVRIGSATHGQVNRITATARCGDGKVIDIEREVKLGGASHTKGVMILSNLLATRYSKDQPLSLTASLVFEQSHARINGDSASLAEFCVLISALADVPIRLQYALTGAVDQHGRVLPIGSVNDKVEGFFDLCCDAGLTGRQGVLVPEANRHSLMLRPDLVTAVTEGRFHLYTVRDVDEALGLLTGRHVGVRGPRGAFPAGSLNRIVEERLLEFTRSRKMPAGKMPEPKKSRGKSKAH